MYHTNMYIPSFIVTAAYCYTNFSDVSENISVTYHPRWPQRDTSPVVIVGSIASLDCAYPYYVADNANYTCSGPTGEWLTNGVENIEPHCLGKKDIRVVKSRQSGALHCCVRNQPETDCSCCVAYNFPLSWVSLVWYFIWPYSDNYDILCNAVYYLNCTMIINAPSHVQSISPTPRFCLLGIYIQCVYLDSKFYNWEVFWFYSRILSRCSTKSGQRKLCHK